MASKPAAKLKPAEKPVLTLGQQVGKWLLPIVFVGIGCAIIWTFWHAYYYPSR